jgi:N-acetylglutamate synthase-like GNAT family acetyltransferase
LSTIIRQATDQDISLLATLIRDSFRDVAERFELTPENCPTHPSHCTPEWVETALAKGVNYYLLENDALPCGCVALEQARPEVCYLERLAVLPPFRNRGFGRALVNHVINEAKKLGLRRVEIGLISKHTELKEWYDRLGFSVKNTAQFEHLPFEVTFIFKQISRPTASK